MVRTMVAWKSAREWVPVETEVRGRRSEVGTTAAEISLKGSVTISWSEAAARVRSRAYQESEAARTAKRMGESLAVVRCPRNATEGVPYRAIAA
jgi:hypothetical protein